MSHLKAPDYCGITNRVVVMIEYRYVTRKRLIVPFQVFTSENTGNNKSRRSCDNYDFDWCKRDTCCYWHNSGTGGSPYLNKLANPARKVPLWFNRDLVTPTNDSLPIRKLSEKEIISIGYNILDKPLPILGGSPNPFEMDGSDMETEFCSRCWDHLPTDRLCDHIGWCDDCCLYTGPVSDPCRCKRSGARKELSDGN